MQKTRLAYGLKGHEKSRPSLGSLLKFSDGLEIIRSK